MSEKAEQPEKAEPPAKTGGHDAEKPSSLTAKAYGEILRRILRLELQPGRAFTEGELATELGLSKTPVGEALLILGSHGFVFPRPRTGYRVAPVTLKDARDIFALWKSIEPESAAMTARRGVEPKLILHLEDLASHEVDTADESSVDDFVDEEVDFHRHLVGESGNARMARTMHVLLHDFERLLRLALRPDLDFQFDGHDHDKLVAAVANREPDAAREFARTAIERWEAVVVDALLSSDALQAVNLGAPLTGRDE
jgi:DNA-binding GntR family transcriptional regulator